MSRAAAEVDGRLLSVLRDRHALAKHCEAVRRYLLLAQGDFVTALMDLVHTLVSMTNLLCFGTEFACRAMLCNDVTTSMAQQYHLLAQGDFVTALMDL